MNHPKPSTFSHSAKLGSLYAILAYGAWGLLPLYWKLFGQIPALEVLSHRIIWSAVLLSGVLLIQQRGAEFRELGRSPQQLRGLLATALLLSLNWGLYIYAVNSDRVVESSLGYFINPLINVLLGFLVLKERLSRNQKLAVRLACVGVGYFVWQFGQIPWIALALAFTFGFYGLLRKMVPVRPMVGLAVETLLVTPIALIAVLFWSATGVGHLGQHWTTDLLFIGCGVITSLPLLWFNNAAKQLKLSTLGFFQYIAPSLQLLLGIFLYHEPFTLTHAITFGLIWSALAIYSLTAWEQRQRSI